MTAVATSNRRPEIDWRRVRSDATLPEENDPRNSIFQPMPKRSLPDKLKQPFTLVSITAAVSPFEPPGVDSRNRSGTVTTGSIANTSLNSVFSGAVGAAQASEAMPISPTDFVLGLGGNSFIWAITTYAAADAPILSLITKTRSSATSARPTATTVSPLVARIENERRNAEIDDEYVDVADAAVKDALALLQHTMIAGTPRTMFSDDGILTLQWRRGELGVALIFAGDGMASIAFKRPGQFYAENGIEVAISGKLPSQFYDALVAISA